MKLSVSLAFVLFISLFLAGNILIFGFITTKIFFILTYFFFSLFFILLVVYSMKKSFNSKDLLIVFIFVLLISVSAAYSAEGIKKYLDKNQQMTKETEALSTQIDVMNQSLNYLKNQIIAVQYNSTLIQNEINSIKSNKVIPPQNTIQNPVVPIIIYEDDYEEEEDD